MRTTIVLDRALDALLRARMLERGIGAEEAVVGTLRDEPSTWEGNPWTSPTAAS